MTMNQKAASRNRERVTESESAPSEPAWIVEDIAAVRKRIHPRDELATRLDSIWLSIHPFSELGGRFVSWCSGPFGYRKIVGTVGPVVINRSSAAVARCHTTLGQQFILTRFARTPR